MMMFRTSRWIVLLWAVSTATLMGDQSPQTLPPPPPEAAAPSREQPPQPPPAPRPRANRPTPAPPQPNVAIESSRRTRGKDVNLQVEITISDQSGTLAPEKKVVSMMVADNTMGRIRASADAQRPGMGMVGTGLNVDARPMLLDGDRILLELTVEYTPFREGGQVAQRPTVLNESLSVILQNGKPMVVSQAADPVTDRRMTVEVRAAIVK
jgi:hypothetical protein